MENAPVLDFTNRHGYFVSKHWTLRNGFRDSNQDITINFFPIDHTWTQMEETVVLQIRLPRILLALLIGAGLSIAGASFQGMFGNPLVSPDILGVSAGAGFGASLGILLLGHGFATQVMALGFGLAAIVFTFVISGKKIHLFSCSFWLVLLHRHYSRR